VSLNFGIITPTFNRPVLLRRHLQRISKQSYHQWRLLVIHDGPNPSIRSLVDEFRKTDERLTYTETAVAAKNAGLTPRLIGIKHFSASNNPPDYLLSWDDDNSYSVDALERIANALELAGLPDLLLVCVKYGAKFIPPADVPIRSLAVGQIDTASLIFRPSLAKEAYSNVHQRWEDTPKAAVRFDDFLAYRYVTELIPPRSIARDTGVLVCQHDGLRWGPYIRTALGIPPLGLARLIGLGR
jgi:glycosyltransferase involved in cell wall biosynthesis